MVELSDMGEGGRRRGIKQFAGIKERVTNIVMIFVNLFHPKDRRISSQKLGNLIFVFQRTRLSFY